MRFVVFANIQANIQALTAVLGAVGNLKPAVDDVVAAGDLVGRGPNPNEVLDLLREEGVHCIRGNYDDAVAFDRLGSGVDFATLREEDHDRRALAWTVKTLRSDNLEYLRGLPSDLRLLPLGSRIKMEKNVQDQEIAELRKNFFTRLVFGGFVRNPRMPGDTSKRVRIMHGSPRSLNEFVREETANSILTTIGRDVQADVFVTAHAQTQFRREIGEMTVVGVGPVSSPQYPGVARFTLVQTRKEIDVEFHDVSYDQSAYMRTLLESELPSDVNVL